MGTSRDNEEKDNKRQMTMSKRFRATFFGAGRAVANAAFASQNGLSGLTEYQLRAMTVTEILNTGDVEIYKKTNLAQRLQQQALDDDSHQLPLWDFEGLMRSPNNKEAILWLLQNQPYQILGDGYSYHGEAWLAIWIDTTFPFELDSKPPPQEDKENYPFLNITETPDSMAIEKSAARGDLALLKKQLATLTQHDIGTFFSNDPEIRECWKLAILAAINCNQIRTARYLLTNKPYSLHYPCTSDHVSRALRRHQIEFAVMLSFYYPPEQKIDPAIFNDDSLLKKLSEDDFETLLENAVFGEEETQILIRYQYAAIHDQADKFPELEEDIRPNAEDGMLDNDKKLNILKLAIKYHSQNVIEHMLEHWGDFSIDQFIISAAQYGRQDLLSLIEQKGIWWNKISDETVKVALTIAVENGRTNVVDLLHKKTNITCETSALTTAASRGDMPMMTLLRSQGLNATSEAADAAAENGHMDILEKLIEDNIYCTSTGANALAMQGELSWLQRLYDQGVECSESCISPKLLNHLDVIQFLLTTNNVIQKRGQRLINLAVENGSLDVLKYLHNRGLTPQPSAVDEAASQSHRNTVEFILNHYNIIHFWINDYNVLSNATSNNNDPNDYFNATHRLYSRNLAGWLAQQNILSRFENKNDNIQHQLSSQAVTTLKNTAEECLPGKALTKEVNKANLNDLQKTFDEADTLYARTNLLLSYVDSRHTQEGSELQLSEAINEEIQIKLVQFTAQSPHYQPALIWLIERVSPEILNQATLTTENQTITNGIAVATLKMHNPGIDLEDPYHQAPPSRPRTGFGG